MSIQPPSGPVGLPVVNQASEPEWVRHGPPSTQKAYDAALSFEQTLVEQLARSLTATSGLDGESSQEGESGSEEGSSSGVLSSMLPQALSSGIMNAGGLGLAAQLTQGLHGTPGTGASTQSGTVTAAQPTPDASAQPGTVPTAQPGTVPTVGAAGGTGAAATGGTGS